MKKTINIAKDRQSLFIPFQKRIKKLIFTRKFKTTIKVTGSTFAMNNGNYFHISTINTRKPLFPYQAHIYSITKFWAGQVCA